MTAAKAAQQKVDALPQGGTPPSESKKDPKDSAETWDPPVAPEEDTEDREDELSVSHSAQYQRGSSFSRNVLSVEEDAEYYDGVVSSDADDQFLMETKDDDYESSFPSEETSSFMVNPNEQEYWDSPNGQFMQKLLVGSLAMAAGGGVAGGSYAGQMEAGAPEALSIFSAMLIGAAVACIIVGVAAAYRRKLNSSDLAQGFSVTMAKERPADEAIKPNIMYIYHRQEDNQVVTAVRDEHGNVERKKVINDTVRQQILQAFSAEEEFQELSIAQKEAILHSQGGFISEEKALRNPPFKDPEPEFWGSPDGELVQKLFIGSIALAVGSGVAAGAYVGQTGAGVPEVVSAFSALVIGAAVACVLACAIAAYLRKAHSSDLERGFSVELVAKRPGDGAIQPNTLYIYPKNNEMVIASRDKDGCIKRQKIDDLPLQQQVFQAFTPKGPRADALEALGERPKLSAQLEEAVLRSQGNLLCRTEANLENSFTSETSELAY